MRSCLAAAWVGYQVTSPSQDLGLAATAMEANVVSRELTGIEYLVQQVVRQHLVGGSCTFAPTFADL